MSSNLEAGYRIQIGKLYEGIKESIPVNGTPVGILKFIKPEIDEAFDMGLEYARIVDHKKEPEDIEIDMQPITVEFILGYNEAKKIRDFKTKNRLVVLRLQGVKDTSGDEQIKQAQTEYENKIRSLSKRAITNASNQASTGAFENG